MKLAEQKAFYASRADSKNPLPVLVLCALLRSQLEPELFVHMEAYLEPFTPEDLTVARRTADPRLAPLVELICADHPLT